MQWIEFPVFIDWERSFLFLKHPHGIVFKLINIFLEEASFTDLIKTFVFTDDICRNKEYIAQAEEQACDIMNTNGKVKAHKWIIRIRILHANACDNQ